MKIIFYTDLHFRFNGDFFKISKNGHSNLLNHLTDALKWLESVIEEEKPDLVICGGDIYHQMNSLDSHTVTVSFSALKSLCDVCLSVGAEHRILLGNHDFISESREVSIVDFLNSFKKTKLINTLSKEDNLLFCPYYFSKENLILNEDLMSEKDKTIFFGHLSLQGGFYKKNQKLNTFLSEEQAIDLTKQVKSFCLAFNGHHHIPQKMGNVIFPGSFIQVNIDEPEHEISRGIYVIDSKTFNYKLIKNEFSPKMQRIYDLEILKNLGENNYIYFANENPEIIEKANKEELNRFLGFRTEKLAVQKENKTSKTEFQFETKTNLELLEHYISSVGSNNKENTIKLGRSCLNEASSISS